jgi:hypothetical protein
LTVRAKIAKADALKGANFARRALEVAGDDPGILVAATLALAYFGEDIGAMIALVDRALALNPNFAWLARQRHPQGVGGLARPRNRAPRSRAAPQSRVRVGSSLAFIGIAHFLCRRFDEAVPKLLLAIQEDPSYSQPYRYLAALLLAKPL